MKLRGLTRRRGLATAAAAIALTLTATACGGGSGSGNGDVAAQELPSSYGEPVDGGELKVGYIVGLSSADPIRGGSGGDHHMLYTMYDRLVNFSDDMKAEPGLAKSFEYLDPTTLELKLQEGVTFHDGTAFNAEAVKYNLDRARTSEISNVKAELGSVTSVDVIDDYTVQLNLAHPDSSLPLILADRSGMMVSPTVADQGDDAIAQQPTGTGPFKLVSHAPGDSLEVERYEEYWNADDVHLDKISFKFITNIQTLTNSITSGEVNFAASMIAQTWQTLSTNSQLVVDAQSTLQSDGCYMNATMAPTDNVKLRQAIAYAIDYESFKEAITFGAGGEVASSIFPSEYWAYPTAEWPYEYDPEKAKQLVAESGIENPTVEAITHTGPGEQRKLELIQGYLKEAGISLTIDIQEVGAATMAYVDQKFNLYCASWTGRPDPSQTYQNLLSPTGYFNGGKYSEPDAQEKIDAGNEVVGDDARVEAFEPTAQYFVDSLLFLPMVFSPRVTAMDPSVKGYVPKIYGKTDVSFLWIDEG
ncbi:ABC transporter substrate-binding protein [Cumulibacter soli]|uniref:ABC transporter substrate-binding protein n=1 Tax=Cumulibacter soli TaxID=2546344 RepID=UPI0010687528|nr:ABC transporter substrate-binding protein [Cumulibacter soli]